MRVNVTRLATVPAFVRRRRACRWASMLHNGHTLLQHCLSTKHLPCYGIAYIRSRSTNYWRQDCRKNEKKSNSWGYLFDMTAQNAVRAADFIDQLGVTTHIHFTTSRYRDITADIKALNYLGVTHIRETAPNPNGDILGQNHLADAAKAGMDFTFVAQGATAPSTVVSRIHSFLVKH